MARGRRAHDVRRGGRELGAEDVDLAAFLGGDVALSQISAKTHQDMENEIDELIDEAEQEATRLLTQHQDVLAALAERLEVEEPLLCHVGPDAGWRTVLKPFIEDLDVLRWSEESESLPNKLWQGLVGVVGEILEDQSRDRIATKIPFKGNLENPEADVWATLGNLLKNAFIEALRRGLEGRISFGTAKNSED